MASAMAPILGVYWDEAGRKARARLGLDPDSWSVVNPHTADAIRAAALDFCRATNATTSLGLADALDALRDELVRGVVLRGDSLEQLTRRVNGVFDTAEKWRARRIAATEASRAVHQAQYQSAVESDLVAGFEALISGDACPLCRKIVAEAPRVPLGRDFAVIGDHPVYSRIRTAPFHPSCQCTVVEVLKPQYGGPADPEWSDTLDQPQRGLPEDYTPPEGTPEPEPQPDRPTPVPIPPAAKPPATAAERIARAADLVRAAGVLVVEDGAAKAAELHDAHLASEVPAFYVPAERTVYFNPAARAYWDDPATYMGRAFVSGWFSTGSPDHVARHELGHALHHRALGDAYLDPALRRPPTAAQLAAIGRGVSDYGRTKPVEFVAETFAGLRAGKAYPESVMQLYRDLGGPTP